MNRLDCEIVQDLLPGYIERLTSEHTNQAIEAHLEDCDACRSVLEGMTAKLEGEEEIVRERQKAEPSESVLLFLKKMRARAFRRGALIAALIVGLAAGVIGYGGYWGQFRVSVPVEGVNYQAFALPDGSVYMALLASEEYQVIAWHETIIDNTCYINAQVKYKETLTDKFWDALSEPVNINQTYFVFMAEELEKDVTRVVYTERLDYEKYQTTQRELVLYEKGQALPVLEETPEIEPHNTWLEDVPTLPVP